MLQWVVCCSVLQCVALYYNVVQCVAMYCTVLHCGAVLFSGRTCWMRVVLAVWACEDIVLRCVLQSVAVCCSVLQHVAVCGSMLQWNSMMGACSAVCVRLNIDWYRGCCRVL